MIYFSSFIVLAAIVYISGKNRDVGTKRCVVFCTVFLFIILAFRSTNIGGDTERYVSLFETVKGLTFPQISKQFGSEPLVYYLFKVVDICFNGDFQWVIIIISLLFVSALGYLIYTLSTNSLFSYIMLLSLGFIYFSTSGLRQTIAMSILIFSYHFIKKRRFLPFLILVLLAFFAHNTSIIFLFAYFVRNIKIDFKQIFILFVCVCVSVFFKLYFADYIKELFRGRFSYYAFDMRSASWTGFLIQFCIMVLSIMFYETAVKQNKENLTLYNLMFIGLCIQSFAINFAEMFRLSMYFSVFNVALIPNAISSSENPKVRNFVEGMTALIFLVYYFAFTANDSTIIPYEFFWQI